MLLCFFLRAEESKRIRFFVLVFFQKAYIVRKMDFYKDKSLFLCQYQLFIVLLHRVCAELPVRAGYVWARFYWKKRHTTLCFWSLEPRKFKVRSKT